MMGGGGWAGTSGGAWRRILHRVHGVGGAGGNGWLPIGLGVGARD